MTSNQIAYAKAQEERRHNRAMEKQAERELSETQRSNLERESNNRYVTTETQRHNLVTEGTNTILAQETQRSNRVKEQESIRSNAQKERENYRHNRSMEDLGVYELAEKRNVRQETARQFDAAQALRELSFKWQQFLDDWNQQNAILYREENRRHNLAQESIGYGNIGVGWAQAAASQQQAQAAQKQAQAALQNAASNEINAYTAWRRERHDYEIADDEQLRKWTEMGYKYPFGVKGSQLGAGMGWLKSLADTLQGISNTIGGID